VFNKYILIEKMHGKYNVKFMKIHSAVLKWLDADTQTNMAKLTCKFLLFLVANTPEASPLNYNYHS
jgi:uncharacterized protein YacL (UPF0231 family)